MPTNKREGEARRGSSSQRPQRPLSAFNLFYRYKRQKVLDTLADTNNATKVAICALVAAPAGLEECTEAAISDALAFGFSAELNALRRSRIRSALESNLEPRRARSRLHRTNRLNGSMSFVELGKIMNESWRDIDDYARSVFQELAAEGRKIYLQKADAYRAQGKMKPRRKMGQGKKKRKVEADAAANPPTKDDSADEGMANEAAECMLQLSKRSPKPKDPEAAPPDAAAPPDLLDLLSKKQPQEAISNAEAAPVSPHATSYALDPQPSAIALHLAEESLKWRLRELEGEMARRQAREELLRLALRTTAAPLKALAAAAYPARQGGTSTTSGDNGRPLVQDGLWSLMSERRMVDPDTPMLSRIVEREDMSPKKQRLV